MGKFYLRWVKSKCIWSFDLPVYTPDLPDTSCSVSRCFNSPCLVNDVKFFPFFLQILQPCSHPFAHRLIACSCCLNCAAVSCWALAASTFPFTCWLGVMTVGLPGSSTRCTVIPLIFSRGPGTGALGVDESKLLWILIPWIKIYSSIGYFRLLNK